MRRLRPWVIRLTTSLTRRQDESRLREEISLPARRAMHQNPIVALRAE